MDFKDLLKKHEIEASDVLVLRYVPTAPGLRSVFVGLDPRPVLVDTWGVPE